MVDNIHLVEYYILVEKGNSFTKPSSHQPYDLVLSALHFLDISPAMNSHMIVMLKYSNVKFVFALDTFFTFALRNLQWLVVIIWLLLLEIF